MEDFLNLSQKLKWPSETDVSDSRKLIEHKSISTEAVFVKSNGIPVFLDLFTAQRFGQGSCLANKTGVE